MAYNIITVLSREDLEALANAAILAAAPGRVISMARRHLPNGSPALVVRSILASPFSNRTASLWETILDLTDGHTVESTVIATSQKIDPKEA